MSDAVWKRHEIQSPCVKICVIDRETRLCTGCYRSIDEIGTWSLMSNEERSAVMDELPGRAGQLSRRRGGRRARMARSGGSSTP